jgi:NADH-quinone oxidoreductase subunit L
MPLFVLAFLSIVAGWLQMPWSVLKFEKFLEWVEPSGQAYYPSLTEPYYEGQRIMKHAAFNASAAALSVTIAVAGLIVSFAVCRAVYEKGFLRGLTKRNKLAGAIYAFLINKYYLDALYEKVIVQAIAHPIAKGVYWVNQNILDAIVNGAATTGKSVSRWVYRNIDQKGIDGAVNGAGQVSSGTGGLLRGLQSGKVQQYGALLFGAAAVGALILVVTVSGS